MSEPIRFCKHCSAPMNESANFCEACGHKVEREEPAPQPVPEPASAAVDPAQPAPPVPPPPAAAVPAPQPAKSRSSLPYILGGLGCLLLVCIAVAIVGSLFVLRAAKNIADDPGVLGPGVVETAQALVETAPALVEATLAPDATSAPVNEDGLWSQDAGQELTDELMRDDFSGHVADWGETDSEDYAWGYEGERYMVNIKTEEYTTWAYLPVDFDPSEIYLDAAIQPGYVEGGYGVMCHIQDDDNYYYALVDPNNQEYSIGLYQDGEDHMLLDDWWLPTSYLRSSPVAVNQLNVLCEADHIALYVNGELEKSVDIEPAEPGRMAIFAETWDEKPSGGFKVLFDNLTAFK